MFEPKTIYAKIAYDAILLYMKTGKKILKKESEIPAAMKLKLPCFVTIFHKGEVRGRKGSIEISQENLYNEIIENAIAAAYKDQRFGGLKEVELNNITLTVDVLSEPKPFEDRSILKPHKHGIVVKDEEGNQSVVLPNADGISSIEGLINAAKQKAGIDEHVSESKLKVWNFTTTRYE